MNNKNKLKSDYKEPLKYYIYSNVCGSKDVLQSVKKEFKNLINPRLAVNPD